MSWTENEAKAVKKRRPWREALRQDVLQTLKEVKFDEEHVADPKPHIEVRTKNSSPVLSLAART